jgi:hypothetical protein
VVWYSWEVNYQSSRATLTFVSTRKTNTQAYSQHLFKLTEHTLTYCDNLSTAVKINKDTSTQKIIHDCLAHKAIVQYTADKKEYVRHNMHGMCWQLSLMGYNHCCVPSGTLLHNAFIDPTVVFSTQQHRHLHHPTQTNPTVKTIIYSSTSQTQSKMTNKTSNSMDMSSLTNSLAAISITPASTAKPRPKGKITRNVPYERELEAKKNGTYVNTYTTADDKKLRDYCNGQPIDIHTLTFPTLHNHFPTDKKNNSSTS